MKRLCFGTILNLLYQARTSQAKQHQICRAMFSAFNTDMDSYDNSIVGHLKSGHDNVPADLLGNAKTLSIDEVSDRITTGLLPLIKQEKYKSFVRAVKAILREDTTIAEDTVIGKIPGYEKKSIISCSTFTFNELIAHILYYVIVNVSNRECVDAIKEVGGDFLVSFDNSTEKIFFDSVAVSSYEVHFQTEKTEALVPLKKSLRGSDFDKTFFKVCDGIFASANNSTAQFYTVEIGNCILKFRTLAGYLENHIGEYVLSRSQITDFENKGESYSIGLKAAKAFIKKSKINGAWKDGTLGEILLYMFLEQELNAPKILSKFEVNAVSGSVESKCDGVYLLSTEDAGLPFHQLVFGASDIVDNLTDAVNHAFDKVVTIQDNEKNEFQMVEETVYKNIYDPETTKFMEKVILPQPPEVGATDMAFGVFLGYTLGLDSTGLSAPVFKKQALEKIRSDIETIKPHIVSKIRELGLDGYSFYFYVLPFNDAPSEKTRVIEEAFDGGVE